MQAWAKRLKISIKALQIVCQCAGAVWQEIGCDVLYAMGNKDQRRSFVLEVVFDCNRVDTKVKEDSRFFEKEAVDEALKLLGDYDKYPKIKQAMKACEFTCQWYGL